MTFFHRSPQQFRTMIKKKKKKHYFYPLMEMVNNEQSMIHPKYLALWGNKKTGYRNVYYNCHCHEVS